MPETPRPARTAVALATVRRQLEACAAFGIAVDPDHLDAVAVRLTQVLRDYAESDTRRYPRLRRPLRPRSASTVHPWRVDRAHRDPEHPSSS
ncbi:DUF6374 family protein [Nocardia neocaledoniensis]|uniref:DUF6374 family protein n=1 Tax=Nocardia neocaledoniensis TaxID=236511 RepID=UPI00245391C5|nr:DUF6374 family protein [Nocardia neocaledoniensis]